MYMLYIVVNWDGTLRCPCSQSVQCDRLWVVIIFVDVLMAQLVRALTGWLAGLGGWCHAWGPQVNPRPGLGSVG